MTPRLIDNDAGEITARLDGRELRGWSYASDDERRQKMLLAREYVEGWHDASTDRAAPPSVAPVAWRYRSKDEPKWEYSDKPLIPKDLFRMEPGFEEQPVYAAPPSVALEAVDDGYRAAWLEMVEHCNKLKEENFNLRTALTRPQPGGAVAGTERGGPK